MNASTMSKKRKLEYHPGSSNHPSSLTVVTVLDQINRKNMNTLLQKEKIDGTVGSNLNLPSPPPSMERKVDVDMPLRVQTASPPHGAVESQLYSSFPLMEVKVNVDMPLRAQTASPPLQASPAEKKRKVTVYGGGGETIDSETCIAHVSEGSKGIVISVASRETADDDEIIDDEQHYSTILFLRRTEDGKFLPMKNVYDTEKAEMLERALKKTGAFVFLPNRCEHSFIHPVKIFDCLHRKFGGLTLIRRRLGMHLIDILDEVLGEDFKIAKSYTEQVRHLYNY